jgi:hypothetical protein
MDSKPEGSVKQFANGMTVADLRNDIQLTHNSRKNGMMMLIFKEDQKRYYIADDKQFNEIIKMHTENKDLDQILREYASTHLEEVV